MASLNIFDFFFGPEEHMSHTYVRTTFAGVSTLCPSGINYTSLITSLRAYNGQTVGELNANVYMPIHAALAGEHEFK